MISRYSIRERGKTWAQDGGPGDTSTGVQILLKDPDDYNEAVAQALRIFTNDRPHLRIADVTVAAAGFRYVLSGPGAVLAGANAWEEGFSQVQAVWFPWSLVDQGVEPLDANTWRTMQGAEGDELEFTYDRPAIGQVFRLQFTKRHTLTEAPNVVTNPSAAPAVALVVPDEPGDVDNGAHAYVYTWTTVHGETLPSAAAIVTVTDKATNGQVQVEIPASDDSGVTGARVYRTAAGDTAGLRRLVATLTGNGGVVVDSLADAGLGAAAPSANTAGGANTVRDGDEDLLALLAGAMMLQMAAVKAVQNTGNTGLPNDVVDRRSQSDIFRSRSKELRGLYDAQVGKGADDDVGPASAIRDLDVMAGHRGGWIFHGTRNS